MVALAAKAVNWLTLCRTYIEECWIDTEPASAGAQAGLGDHLDQMLARNKFVGPFVVGVQIAVTNGFCPMLAAFL